ncbi:hypothetical protein [Streptomyces swartbergensis]|uniref:hypothetical protein n=1 Tax=Streptomyces swartbergensis TaxID=487165 RepID=UPI0037F8B11E
MVVWSGWGLVVFPIVVLGILVGKLIGRLIGIDEQISSHLGAVGAGICLWFIGRYMNRDVLYVHPEGNVYLPRNRHRLYGIPVQYMSVPVVLLAIVILVFEQTEN